jgi:tRNA1(Val) A37 N6-methylase TrmN6
MSVGGFDVVIGNPPYIAKRKIEDYSYSGFITDNCPDIYAPCMERAANLLNDVGCFAMIVPISFQFSEDFSEAREVLSKFLPTKWISTLEIHLLYLMLR